MAQDLNQHLASGDTTVCRAWKVVRKDGVTFGFTDHDRDLSIAGLTYSARTGLSARALQQTTGMSVDNSEAVGALSDASVREEDILAGRFDDAEVTALLVNWQDTGQRKILFRGNFGEITRENGAFKVELRGLTERLNLPMGRTYHAACSATFGDRACKIDVSDTGMSAVVTVVQLPSATEILVNCDLTSLPAMWFAHGAAAVLSGAAIGAGLVVRADVPTGDFRRLSFWKSLPLGMAEGDSLRLVAGCDKRFETCIRKFENGANFRGFPHIPGDDWLRRSPEA